MLINRKQLKDLFVEKKDMQCKSLVVRGHRIRLSWILEVFCSDGMEGINEYVAHLVPEHKTQDILKSALYYLYLRDERINI